MAMVIKHIDDDFVIIYSSVHDCYYLKNIMSQLVSSKSFRTAEDALDNFTNHEVMYIEDVIG